VANPTREEVDISDMLYQLVLVIVILTLTLATSFLSFLGGKIKEK